MKTLAGLRPRHDVPQAHGFVGGDGDEANKVRKLFVTALQPQKIPEQAFAFGCKDGLGVELHAVDGK